MPEVSNSFSTCRNQNELIIRAGLPGNSPDLFPPNSLLPFPAFVSITEEIQKRRTFAIISHPDAGKTTLTEKLLLYGGAVQLAGSVTARKNQRATTSDWMELDRPRGISVASAALDYQSRDAVV